MQICKEKKKTLAQLVKCSRYEHSSFISPTENDFAKQSSPKQVRRTIFRTPNQKGFLANMDFQVVRNFFSYMETTGTLSRKRRTVGGEESAFAWACILCHVHLSPCPFRLSTVVCKRCRAEIIF
ncbi:uncharacterized protein LOC143148127 [Ptiloglossa arizonensis]|uniref:uncharacterized protein LOC143148127 n=1 Tax=Ptiloglossa arizonensis TaxID=3350558 RepID=UPI003FA0AF11